MGVANKFILFPADQTEIYHARFETPSGTRIEETSEQAGILSREIKKVLGENVSHIIARAGVAKDRPDDPKAKEGNNVGMVSMYMSEWAKDNMPHTEVLSMLRKIKVPGIESLSFEEQVNGPPVGSAIEATFRSNSL